MAKHQNEHIIDKANTKWTTPTTRNEHTYDKRDAKTTKKQTDEQKRKDLLLEAESSFVNYEIEEIEGQRKVQTEQISGAISRSKLGLYRQEQDTSTFLEIYKKRKKEDSKSPMVLNINTDQDETKLEEKLDQKTENITSME
ncbi:hypothetical protein C2G38_2168966 [Gigaspora rosea]|uniref:Uncharacterized protein n=1 Tax=Gigaspora rosea TaxID=44941 RepID=A0A397VP77_9GLOM|nr:hypothetical protein C2G38_2168966 [Gigaspora rosea]